VAVRARAHLFGDLQQLFVLHALFGSSFTCDLHDERDRPLHLEHGGGLGFTIYILNWLAFFFEIESFVFWRYHALHLHAAWHVRGDSASNGLRRNNIRAPRRISEFSFACPW
jgi:hypothetical protein